MLLDILKFLLYVANTVFEAGMDNVDEILKDAQTESFEDTICRIIFLVTLIFGFIWSDFIDLCLSIIDFIIYIIALYMDFMDKLGLFIATWMSIFFHWCVSDGLPAFFYYIESTAYTFTYPSSGSSVYDLWNICTHCFADIFTVAFRAFIIIEAVTGSQTLFEQEIMLPIQKQCIIFYETLRIWFLELSNEPLVQDIWRLIITTSPEEVESRKKFNLTDKRQLDDIIHIVMFRGTLVMDVFNLFLADLQGKVKGEAYQDFVTAHYKTLFCVCGICFLLAAIIGCVAMLLTFMYYTDIEKLSSYECGFEPFDDSRARFNIHFYVVGILFIILDLEFMTVFPYAIYISFSELVSTLGFTSFITILTVGFIYEWGKGAFRWQ